MPSSTGTHASAEKNCSSASSSWSHAGEELEADNLAGHDGLVLADEPVEQIDCGLGAAEVVDRNARVEQLHSTPSRRRRSLRSPRTAST